MDQACQCEETLQLAREPDYERVVPPHPDRRDPWPLDPVGYARRDEIERLFRRVFSRYDKLDLMFAAFLFRALPKTLLSQSER